jgi:histidinol-phosphatase (PHP family)
VDRPDYHLHLERIALSRDSILRFMDAAVAAGVTELGFTEHAHNFTQCRSIYPPDNDWIQHCAGDHRRDWDLDEYVRVLEGVRAEGAPVRISMEWDYCPGRERELERWIDNYPWDYTLGAVHWLPARGGGWWGFDIPDMAEEWNLRSTDEVYAEYFRLAVTAVETGLFDVFAHPDVVKVFGHRPKHDPAGDYERLARALADTGTAAEISTAGLRKPVGEIYPAPPLLAAIAGRDVAVTISSDAHELEHVGFAFDRAEAAARHAGYGRRAVFRGRQRVLVPLESAG